MSFFKLLYLLPFLIAGSAVTGCGDDVTDPDDGDHNHAHARILFYNGGTESLNLVIDNVVVAIREAKVKNENYAEIEEGNYTVQFVQSSTSTALAETTFNFVEDGYYSAFAVENLDGSVTGLIAEDDLTAPEAGKVHVRLANLVADAPAAKVAVPGSGGGPIFNNIAFPTLSSTYAVLDAGTYNFRAQDAAGGGGTPLVSDFEVTLEEGKIYTLAMVGLMGDGSGEMILIEHTPVDEE